MKGVHDTGAFLAIPTHSIAYCPEQHEDGILWPRTESNSEVSKSCALAGTLFRQGTVITRSCSVEGIWRAVDLSTCTLITGSPPFLLLSFVLETEEQARTVEDITGYSEFEVEVCNFVNVDSNQESPLTLHRWRSCYEAMECSFLMSLYGLHTLLASL